MKYARLLFWAILVPAVLLIFALKMNTHLSDVKSGALEEREREERNNRMLAETERQNTRYNEDQLRERSALATSCVARALRTLGGDLASASSMLVIVNYKGCGTECDTDAIASRFADSYALEGLKVLLIRTIDENQRPQPLGVHTVAITDCQPLAANLGDDYFFRNAKGELSSSGEIHEAYLRRGFDLIKSFDPDPLVRQQMGLPPATNAGAK